MKNLKKAILIDGNNILFRSYYATAYNGNTMKNSKGFPTNALYGLINMLNKIITEEKPEYIMIAFDKGKTFRHEMYSDYKGGRLATPEDLIVQFPVAKRLVAAMGMVALETDNYEADDIIGTFARKINEDPEFIGTIISSDKDLLQLITDEIDIKLLKQVGNVRMYPKEFREFYGIDPIRMIDLKALMGDPSDNIPGVKGIGEKTALTLLKEYDNLDNLYLHIDEVKGKLQEKLILGKEQAYLSLKLATIITDVPIDTDLTKIIYKGIDPLKYKDLLEELEFYSLIKKMDSDKSLVKKEEKLDDIIIVTEVEQLDKLSLNKEFALYLEIFGNNYHRDRILGVGIYNEDVQAFIPVEILKKRPNFFDNDIVKFTYDLKKVLVAFSYQGIKLKNCDFDTMMAAYLLNKNLKDDIAYIANNMGYSIPFYEAIYGTNKVNSRLKEPDVECTADACLKKARFIYETKKQLEDELQAEEAYTLFTKIEMPLIEVLADMEETGVLIDKPYLEKFSQELKLQLELLEKDIFLLAGEEFNLMSPKQLGEVLFKNLNIPYPKKVKDDSYSTNKDILELLAPTYPIVGKILEYRTIAKLYTTYGQGLLSEISLVDFKIHTIYTQMLTRTGRLSSTNPNLQNIPIRLEYGRLIRKAFIPSPDSVLLSSDYSQIELRIFASLAHAEDLINAFKLNKDIHTKTAADIFHVKEEDVTKDMRRSAKAVNFGILYGISSFGLSEDLGIDIASAKQFIDDYLDTYPGIKEYMDDVIKQAHKLGYVKTIMNRKRTIEELNSSNYMVRSGGERMALNTPIQGSSADILKKAMIQIYQIFKEKGLKSKMILQVHDELIFDVLKSEEELVRNIVKDTMENTYKLDVPLRVEIESGSNWYEAN
ncbi:MAG: DNA polymerase I [Bacilli bacterium]